MSDDEPGRLTVSKLPQRLQLKVWSGAVALHRALGAKVSGPLDLTITDGPDALMEIRRAKGRCHLKLHHLFTGSDQDTLEALATLTADEPARARLRWARAQVRAFAQTQDRHLRPAPPDRRVRLKSEGAHHDLAALNSAVILEHFDEDARAEISWGRWGRPHARQQAVRLGSYDARRDLIRVHPVLDQHGVPGWVVKFIIFHEVLHRVVPSQRAGDRFIHHGAAFQAREAAHPDFERFQAWIEAELPALLSGMKAAPEPQ